MSRTLDPRAERIFEVALAGDAPERARIVRDTCRGDARLEREVLELLAAHENAGDFLLAPAIAALPEPSEISGRFRIQRHIGSGSMGTVYLAEQLAPVRRIVALKLLRPGLCSDEALKRFDTERQTIARMNHAGIARLYDSGTSEDGRPWYAMEYVAGEPITAYCKARQLSLFARVRLSIAICRAVHHAHQAGVIHRDLKPGNVLVTEEDGVPTPKIIDFGVAKASTPLGGPAFQTQHGDLLGTLEYMSPEQALGAEGGIDVRTDVYAIGAILYELLTADHPLPIRRARSEGLASVLRILRENEPRKPSARLEEQAAREPDRAHRSALRTLARRVHGDLDWIVLAAVEKDRNRRYSSAAELALDLEHFLAREPVSVAPPSRGYRLARFASRNRIALLVSFAILVSLVGGLAAALVKGQEAAEQRDRALKSASQARAALSEVMFNAGSAVHKTDQELSDLAGGTRARLSFGHWALECLEKIQDQPEARDSIDFHLGYTMQRLGEAELVGGNLEQALVWFERSLEHRVRNVTLHADLQSRRTLGVGQWKSGDIRAVLGEWAQAEECYRSAMHAMEALVAENLFTPDVVDVYLGMGQRRLADAAAARAGDEEALEAYARALKHLELGAANSAEPWPSQREQVLALSGSATLLGRMGRADEAERALEQALALLDLEGARTGPSNVWERSHRARVLLLRSALACDRGAYDAALEDERKALALATAVSSSDRDDAVALLLSARAQSELGRTLALAGRGEDAALVIGSAMPAFEQLVRRAPRHAEAQCELALACQRMALALAGRDRELAGPWQERGRQLVVECERTQRLSPRDRARLAELR